MCIGGKPLQSFSSDSLSGRIRSYLLRMLGLQLLQAAVELVIFIIAESRRIQYVILISVLIQHIPQLFNLFTVIHETLLI